MGAANLWLKIRALFRSPRLEKDLEDELGFHLAMRREKHQASGKPPAEAQAAACREFGNVMNFKEACREMRTFASLEIFWRDLRYALRSLRRSPGFTAVAVVTLALGIGATVSIFSIVYVALLRPLPYPEPDRLVALSASNPKAGFLHGPASAADFYDWRAQNEVFSTVTAYSGWSLNLTEVPMPERLSAALVSPEFFSVLGVAPAQGRGFLAHEDQPDAASVAVVSDRLWTRLFGDSAALAGQTLTLNGSRTTIVGVMPAGFGFPSTSVELWVPLSLTPQNRQNREGRWLSVMARIKPGITRGGAQQNMNVIASRLQRDYPATNTGLTADVVPLDESLVGNLRTRLLVLLGAVGLLLLIACSNVANLLLARAASRTPELALRAAIGASRTRIVRQLLAESLVLALAGGAGGLVLAYWSVSAFRVLAPPAIPRLDNLALDGHVLAFALLLPLVTVLLFGLMPALQSSKLDLHRPLKSGGRTLVGLGLRHRTLLVTSQIALACVLLVGAGLLVKSFLRLMSVNPGFDPRNVITMQLSLPRSGYPNQRQIAFFQQVLERVRALPAVEQAGAISDLPMRGNSMTFKIVLDGRGQPLEPKKPEAGARWVTAGYFSTMRIPLVKGRFLDDRDTASAPLVAVVNRAMMKRYWPTAGAIGARVRLEEDPRWFSIVGVVEDIKQLGLDAGEVPALYLAHAQKSQEWMNWMTLAVRTASDPDKQLNAIRAQVLAVDRNQPVADIVTLDQYLAASVALPRFSSAMVASFSVVALVMALVGIYGIIAYSASQRRHEMGIRMALGARPFDVLRLVAGDGLRMTLIGVLAGLSAALALTRVLANQLFGIEPTDPATFAVMPIILIAVALLASYIPARRATKVDPTAALRHD
jgi:putative ABC transport system permease protein